nr:histidine phosphatase family protein [Enterovibrio paralichthyis]
MQVTTTTKGQQTLGIAVKFLFLTRHAKSCWDDPTLNDHDRPLNHRGKKDAPQMGKRLAAWQGMPDVIVSSSATRAQDTAGLVAEQFTHSPRLLVFPSLYTEDWEDIAAVIEDLDEEYQSAMLVGHNPALNHFLAQVPFELDNLPTCGVVVIRLESRSWRDWREGSKQVMWLDYPKRLKKN